MATVWQRKETEYPVLDQNITCEILVIGGGIAGILCAYQLQKRGHHVVLVEKNKILSGTTSSTTAKITAMQGLLYQELVANFGSEFAKTYYDSQQHAIDRYQSLVEEFAIDCDFKKTDAFLFSFIENGSIYKEIKAYEAMDVPVKRIKTLPQLPLPIRDGLCIRNQALFDPLAFLYALPKEFTIYEDTCVDKIADHMVYANGCTISAKKIILATQYPIKNFPGLYFMKLKPSTSYTCAFEHESEIEGIFLETKENGLSIRMANGYLLVGGLDHRTGEIDQSDKYLRLTEQYQTLFGKKDPTYCWYAEDLMTFDHIPYIGLYHPSTPDLYVITGFNKWGMANAMAGSEVIADLIDQKENAYSFVFSPRRIRIPYHLGSFIGNAFTNTKYIASNYIHITKRAIDKMAPGTAKMMQYQKRRQAVYKDTEGNIHTCPPTCEHMHSKLLWNPNTKNWECPCHGSRYDMDGNILQGPAIEKRAIRKPLEKKVPTIE